MQFSRLGDVYRVVRITGAQDNFLGISLADQRGDIEVVPLHIGDETTVKSTPEEVLEQVIEALAEVNEELGKDYHLKAVFYSPQDHPRNKVYKFLASELIKRIDAGAI